MRNWQWLWAAIPAILILWIAEFIGSFWTGLGVVALLAFLYVLEAFPVSVRRYIAIGFTIWVVYLGLSAVWNAFLATRPLIRDALEKRNVAIDLETSEFLDPMALSAKLGIADYCRELEDIRGKRLDAVLRERLESARREPFGTTTDATKVVMETYLNEIEADRKQCKELLSRTLSDTDLSSQSQLFSSEKWLWALGIAGMILLVVLAFRARWFWSFAFLVAVLLAIGWYLTSGQALMAKVTEEHIPPAPRVQEFTLAAGEELLPVETGPGSRHLVCSDKPWQVVHKRTGTVFDFPAECSPLNGGERAGLIRVRVKEATRLRFERTR